MGRVPEAILLRKFRTLRSVPNILWTISDRAVQDPLSESRPEAWLDEGCSTPDVLVPLLLLSLCSILNCRTGLLDLPSGLLDSPVEFFSCLFCRACRLLTAW